MEAKTKQHITQEILNRYPGIDPEIDIAWDMVEISFKAGQRTGGDWLAGLDEGVVRGRQEVVEFIQQEISLKTTDNGIFISGYIAGNKWQAKLKDWLKDNPELLEKWGI